jgi:hypothetical protein
MKNLLAFAILLSVTGFGARAQALGFSDNGTPPDAARDISELAIPAVERVFKALAPTLSSVNTQDREAARSFYNNYYAASSAAEGSDIGWTGSYGSCTPGTTYDSFKSALLTRVNYFRAMAGVPSSVTFSSTYSAKAQEAALTAV